MDENALFGHLYIMFAKMFLPLLKNVGFHLPRGNFLRHIYVILAHEKPRLPFETDYAIRSYVMQRKF